MKSIFLYVLLFSLIIIIKQLNFDPTVIWVDYSFFTTNWDKNYISQVEKKFYNTPKDTMINTNIFWIYNLWCLEKNINCNVFGHQQFVSDIYRISNIQYISKFIFREKIENFDKIIKNINNLSPKRIYPYIFAQTIWPIPETNNVDEKTKIESWYSTLDIWENGIKYNCEKTKIKQIENWSEKLFLSNIDNTKYQNPCPIYELAHQMWFNYFYYTKNLNLAISRYKISAMHQNSPPMAKTMPAIISSSLWQNQKAIVMRYDRIIDTQSKIKKSKNIKQIEKYEKDIDYFLKKAIFAISIDILEKSEKANLWLSENQNCLKDISCLIDNWYFEYSLMQEYENCKKKSDQDPYCVVLNVGINMNFLSKKWPKYPFDENDNQFEYYRDNKQKNRRIKKID